MLHHSTANTTAVATCCCHYHLLCSWLIVNSFFTLVRCGSHVCLSYAAVTALLSVSLLIAAPQWPTPCCGQSTIATAVFLHAVPLIDRASHSSTVSVALCTLCALAVAAVTALAVAIFIGFLLLQFLWHSMLPIESCWKLFPSTLPLRHAAFMVHCMMLLSMEGPYGAVCEKRTRDENQKCFRSYRAYI